MANRNRRIHTHPYFPRTRQHRVNSGDVGQAISTRTYRHHHNRRIHEHNFHPRTQWHWTQNIDDGRELGPGSYEHSHQGGMDERNRLQRGGYTYKPIIRRN